MKPLLHIGTLAEMDAMDVESWEDSSPEERFMAVEAIRQMAWRLYGAPELRLERVLVIADLPSSKVSIDRRSRGSGARKAKVHRRSRRVRGTNTRKRAKATTRS